ncbi:MAG TPA: hypothetical protein VF173_05825 [Thermoanaerobaculia bacterium]|nr:hypothetical protein [Thermoanaerobaculia bacterium]
MPTLRLVLLVLYLASVLSSGSALTKQGSGWDPNGAASSTTPPPVNVDQGSGFDPMG